MTSSKTNERTPALTRRFSKEAGERKGTVLLTAQHMSEPASNKLVGLQLPAAGMRAKCGEGGFGCMRNDGMSMTNAVKHQLVTAFM